MGSARPGRAWHAVRAGRMSLPVKASFVLIHGAWQGAWAWERVVPLLERAGHRALALDLPGNGTDATPAGAVTLMLYADHVARSIDRVEGPVVVVGHGLGGAGAAQARGPRRSEASRGGKEC